MNTPILRRKIIMRLFEKQLALLCFAFVFLLTLNGCQHKSLENGTMVNDRARVAHAKELLSADTKASVAIANFSNDEDLPDYINAYINTSAPKLDSKDMTQAVLIASNTNKYDPVFLLAVIKTESQFNHLAVGGAGEIGLMQIKPSTAKWICAKSGVPWKGRNSLKDPVYNVKIGALYFKYLKKSLKSKAAHYINAYNMGINNLQRLPATSKTAHPYYSRVMQNYIDIYQELRKIKEHSKKTLASN